MNLRRTLCLITVMVLSGCNQESVKESEQQEQKTLTVEGRIAEKNAQQWEDGRVYITENNYVIYDQETGKPEHHIYKAKEWSREDLNHKNSYDLPRVLFYWDNGAKVSSDSYEQRPKVWSIKTDGTDLRLVADEFNGRVRLVRMSPNNRYLALAYSAEEGMFKVIKDLKTGEYIELGRSRGYPEFLWAEDSSYLYYVDKFKDWKYTLANGKKEETEAKFNEYSVIYGGKRIIVSDLGVGVYDEATNERLYSVVPDKISEIEDARFSKKSISPTGKYAWAETGSHRYFINVVDRDFESEAITQNKTGDFSALAVLGKDAKYARSFGAAQVVMFKLDETKRINNYVIWKQTGGTGQIAQGSSLYNAFANNGDFVKGDEL